jgi:hypothetical protein
MGFVELVELTTPVGLQPNKPIKPNEPYKPNKTNKPYHTSC